MISRHLQGETLESSQFYEPLLNTASFCSTCKSIQKGNNDTCQCECKNYQKKKKDYSLNPCTCIYENNKYLKRVSDDSVILCGERHG